MAKKDLNKTENDKAESGELKAVEQTGEQPGQLGATMGLDVTASESVSVAAVSAAPHDEPDVEAPVNVHVDAAHETTTAELPAAIYPTAAARQGDAQRPICRRHHVLMRSYTSSDVATHYRCPVPDCDQTDKRARTAAAPSEPKTCPKRTCQPVQPYELPQYLEVDEDRTRKNPSQIVLVCPKCGFELKTPRPGIFDRVQRVRELQASDDYAAR